MTDWSGLTWPIIKLIGDLMVIYIFTKFGADWLIYVDASVNKVTCSNFSKFKDKKLQSFLSNWTHNQAHLRSVGHIFIDPVLCWLVHICRCYSANSQIQQFF